MQTGLGLAVVVPSKGENDYAKAELKKFIYECGRTFGVLQYDQESPLKAIAKSVCAELGGLSVRAAPKAHPQASGSVGQMQRTLYSQLRTLLYQIDQNTGLSIDSNHALYPWAVKHSQWLLNSYLVHSDGATSYFRRWTEIMMVDCATLEKLFKQSFHCKSRLANRTLIGRRHCGWERTQKRMKSLWALAKVSTKSAL